MTIGTNEDCIYLGRAIQFGTDTDSDYWNVYSLVGRRLTVAPNLLNTTNLQEAAPITPVAPTTSKPSIDLPVESIELPNALSLGWVRRGSESGPERGTVGFLTNFRQFTSVAGSSNLESGSIAGVQIVPIINTVPSQHPHVSAQKIIEHDWSFMSADATPSPLYVCLNNYAKKQHVIISIGELNQQASINSEVRTGKCT